MPWELGKKIAALDNTEIIFRGKPGTSTDDIVPVSHKLPKIVKTLIVKPLYQETWDRMHELSAQAKRIGFRVKKGHTAYVIGPPPAKEEDSAIKWAKFVSGMQHEFLRRYYGRRDFEVA